MVNMLMWAEFRIAGTTFWKSVYSSSTYKQSLFQADLPVSVNTQKSNFVWEAHCPPGRKPSFYSLKKKKKLPNHNKVQTGFSCLTKKSNCGLLWYLCRRNVSLLGIRSFDDFSTKSLLHEANSEAVMQFGFSHGRFLAYLFSLCNRNIINTG
jgi:hypothetical protein